jgi:hypothetical protein
LASRRHHHAIAEALAARFERDAHITELRPPSAEGRLDALVSLDSEPGDLHALLVEHLRRFAA